MDELNFISPLLGGALIGLAASGMLWANGRVMGISGILGGLLTPTTKDISWRVLFLSGLVIGSLFIPQAGYTVMSAPFDRGLYAALLGGLLVGFGTTLGNGCTSGHGICGISRFSSRSIAATSVFIAFGILSVGLFNHFFGATI